MHKVGSKSGFSLVYTSDREYFDPRIGHRLGAIFLEELESVAGAIYEEWVHADYSFIEPNQEQTGSFRKDYYINDKGSLAIIWDRDENDNLVIPVIKIINPGLEGLEKTVLSCEFIFYPLDKCTFWQIIFYR